MEDYVVFDVKLFLADYAQVAEGKVNALGISWAFIVPGTVSFSVVGLVAIPWDQTNKRHRLSLVLHDGDSQPFLNDDGNPVRVDGEFETGRPPGHPVGSPIAMPLVLGVGPLNLPSDSRFEFVFTIDGESEDGWRVAFNTRADPGPMRMAG